MNNDPPPPRDGLAVTYEDRPWDPDERSEDFAVSRRARLQARGPYRAAVLPSISERSFRLGAEVMAAAEDALLEISRFDAELSSTDLGSADGEVAPLAAVLLRTESASSSQIENVTAGAKALAMATIDEKAGPNAQLVAANVRAMSHAVAMSETLDEDTLLAAHAALLHGHSYAQPGQFRDGQVWIGSNASTPHTASFVPPHPSRVRDDMADLLRFCHRTDLAVLPMVALAHAQFETIHPFADGNGRTGRALVHVLLRRTGTTRRLTVPVSAGLLADTRAYFDALTAYRAGDPAPIVERFTAASFAAVNNGRQLNRDLIDLHDRWKHDVKARRDAAVWRVLPLLVRQPAITVKVVQQGTGVSVPAAQNAIDRLLEAGVVTAASENRRNRVWLADGVIRALDDFAARAGRRG